MKDDYAFRRIYPQSNSRQNGRKGMTATDLSLSMGKNAGFISKLFNPKERLRVNMFHVNTLARIFHCKMSDFFPNPYIEFDETKFSATKGKDK